MQLQSLALMEVKAKFGPTAYDGCERNDPPNAGPGHMKHAVIHVDYTTFVLHVLGLKVQLRQWGKLLSS